MQRTKKFPLVIEACSSSVLLERFQGNNKALDEIQKSLEDYLETKRGAFPRFYFLSNDELLEILSQTRNAKAVRRQRIGVFSLQGRELHEPLQKALQ